MIKKLSLLCFSVLQYTSMVQAQKNVAPPWPGVNYTSAKVFLYNLDNQLYGQYQALKDGVPNFTLLGEGTNLDAQQVKQLEAVLNEDTRVLNEGLSKCYEPHHAVFFYDANGKIVAGFDVCFLCEGIRFYPAKQYKSEVTKYTDAMTKNAQKQLESIKKIFTTAGVPVFKNETEVNSFRDEKVKTDTLTVFNDSVFALFTKGFKTIGELKKAIGDLKYTLDSSRYVPDDRVNKDTYMAELVDYYDFFGNSFRLSCSRKGPYGLFYITDFRIQVKTNLLGSFNIGKTRTEINRQFYKPRAGYVYHRTVCYVSRDRKKTLTIHFGDKTIDQVTYATIPSNNVRQWANRKK